MAKGIDKQPAPGDHMRKQRRRRAKDRHFMDAALDAYVRDQALLLWRDFEVYKARPDTSVLDALKEAGFFEDRHPYEGIWSKRWEAIVLPAAQLLEGDLYGRLELMVREAIHEEREARKLAGDTLFEDLEDYNMFIRRTLNSLLAEDPADKEERT
jgi:hypothetical protein